MLGASSDDWKATATLLYVILAGIRAAEVSERDSDSEGISSTATRFLDGESCIVTVYSIRHPSMSILGNL
jgi:hypothetical protein